MDNFDQKREEIKNVSRKIFAAYGFSKTLLEDIAGAVGIKKNSLYYYFDSKEALFKELINDEAAEYFEKQRKIIETDALADKKMLKCISELMYFIHERSTKYSITRKAYLEIKSNLEKYHQNFRQRQLEIFEKILKQGIESDLFHKHNTKNFAADIILIVQSIELNFYINSNVQFLHEVDFDLVSKTINRIINYMLNGIKK